VKVFSKFPYKAENYHKKWKIPSKIEKFPSIAEHVAFDMRASFLKIPIKSGNFPFITQHVTFDNRSTFLQIPINSGNFL
jgi:transposase